MREREFAATTLGRSRERSPRVAKHLAFHQAIGDRRTIDEDQRFGAALGLGMDGARDELLSRTRLARDEDCRIGGGHGFDFESNSLIAGFRPTNSAPLTASVGDSAGAANTGGPTRCSRAFRTASFMESKSKGFWM